MSICHRALAGRQAGKKKKKKFDCMACLLAGMHASLLKKKIGLTEKRRGRKRGITARRTIPVSAPSAAINAAAAAAIISHQLQEGSAQKYSPHVMT